jgi:hypothetical protein
MEELLRSRLFAFKIYTSGSYIGDEEIINGGMRRYFLMASEACELMILSKEDFMGTVAD